MRFFRRQREMDSSEMDWWTLIIAAYAGIVATGAFALEVRRWFESAPRLSIHIMPKDQMYNLPGANDRTWLFATATNRGNAPTTITHFGLRHYRSWLDRIRSKPAWRGVVMHPHPAAHVSNVPETIQPGEIWQGGVLHDELKSPIDEGLLYVEIYASHSDKPALKRVRVPAEPPADAEQV